MSGDEQERLATEPGQSPQKDVLTAHVREKNIAHDEIRPLCAQSFERLLSRTPPERRVAFELQPMREGTADNQVIFDDPDPSSLMRQHRARLPIRPEGSQQRVYRR